MDLLSGYKRNGKTYKIANKKCSNKKWKKNCYSTFRKEMKDYVNNYCDDQFEPTVRNIGNIPKDNAANTKLLTKIEFKEKYNASKFGDYGKTFIVQRETTNKLKHNRKRYIDFYQ